MMRHIRFFVAWLYVLSIICSVAYFFGHPIPSMDLNGALFMMLGMVCAIIGEETK